MNVNATARARLCPQCANSVDEDAAECPYCKADLFSRFVPQWLKRDESPGQRRIHADHRGRILIPSKFLWPAVLAVVAVVAFFIGGYVQRSRLTDLAQADRNQLQAKDQMIQSQEAQLAQFRQELKENADQLAETKVKLQETEKELTAAKQRLAAASREVERLSASRSAVASRAASRAPDAAPLPAPTRRMPAPGVYETTRATSVYEGPSLSSRVISQIDGGTRINVVGSTGEWLEVRSKHGNPPGYVRSDDARPIARAN